METRRVESNTVPRWEIGKVAFGVNLATPEEELSGKPYSVQAINDRSVAWLRPYEWDKENGVEIWAGTSYPDFVRLVHEAGGTIYEPTEAKEPA